MILAPIGYIVGISRTLRLQLRSPFAIVKLHVIVVEVQRQSDVVPRLGERHRPEGALIAGIAGAQPQLGAGSGFPGATIERASAEYEGVVAVVCGLKP